MDNQATEAAVNQLLSSSSSHLK